MGEFCSGILRRFHVVRAVTSFAGKIRRTVFPVRLHHLRMEGMLRRRVLVALQTIDRLDLFLMRHILRIESGMACDADEFLVRGFGKHCLLHADGNLFAVLFHRERFITMAGEAIFFGLRNEIG